MKTSPTVFSAFSGLHVNGSIITRSTESIQEVQPAGTFSKHHFRTGRIKMPTLLLLLLTGTIFSYFCMSSITSVLILAILIAIVLF